jgi:hypothetical protein
VYLFSFFGHIKEYQNFSEGATYTLDGFFSVEHFCWYTEKGIMRSHITHSSIFRSDMVYHDFDRIQSHNFDEWTKHQCWHMPSNLNSWNLDCDMKKKKNRRCKHDRSQEWSFLKAYFNQNQKKCQKFIWVTHWSLFWLILMGIDVDGNKQQILIIL